MPTAASAPIGVTPAAIAVAVTPAQTLSTSFMSKQRLSTTDNAAIIKIDDAFKIEEGF